MSSNIKNMQDFVDLFLIKTSSGDQEINIYMDYKEYMEHALSDFIFKNQSCINYNPNLLSILFDENGNFKINEFNFYLSNCSFKKYYADDFKIDLVSQKIYDDLDSYKFEKRLSTYTEEDIEFMEKVVLSYYENHEEKQNKKLEKIIC